MATSNIFFKNKICIIYFTYPLVKHKLLSIFYFKHCTKINKYLQQSTLWKWLNYIKSNISIFLFCTCTNITIHISLDSRWIEITGLLYCFIIKVSWIIIHNSSIVTKRELITRKIYKMCKKYVTYSIHYFLYKTYKIYVIWKICYLHKNVHCCI